MASSLSEEGRSMQGDSIDPDNATEIRSTNTRFLGCHHNILKAVTMQQLRKAFKLSDTRSEVVIRSP